MSDSRVPSRRDFLKASAAGAAALAVPNAATARSWSGPAKRCVFINLVGGPAHLDTFDPKPDAPAEIRGPFRTIPTQVPGLFLSELFPRLAGAAGKFSLIRSMNHAAPPIHECGFQLLNTGRLFRDGPEWPSLGAVVSHLLGGPAWRIVPHAAVHTGVNVSHGMGLGFLGTACPPPAFAADRNGRFPAALQAIESGARFVTVNMFDTVFDSVSWDCHADNGSLRTTLDDVANLVAPQFDLGFAGLLSALSERGLLDSTLVVATGEFGRTPRLNSNGGRDHWAGAWTALVAGGGVQGGRVIGRTDSLGSEPVDRPVSPQELVATVCHALGIPQDATIPGSDGRPVAVYPAQPVLELF